jgi:nucleoid DNA-binding protein
MVKSDLVNEVFESLPRSYKNKLNRRVVQKIVDLTFESIIAATLQGEEVKIYGFGNFRPVIKAPHWAYSAQCKGTKMSRPYAMMSFKMSKGWKETFKRILAKGKVVHGKVRIPAGEEGREDQDCRGEGAVP